MSRRSAAFGCSAAGFADVWGWAVVVMADLPEGGCNESQLYIICGAILQNEGRIHRILPTFSLLRFFFGSRGIGAECESAQAATAVECGQSF